MAESQRSRFQRTPASADTAAAASAPTTDATTPAPATSPVDLAALQERARKAQERRMRRELERDRAQADVAECAAQARELGATTPEELEGMIRAIEEEDRAALKAFMQALEAEEALLDDVDRRLSLVDTLEN